MHRASATSRHGRRAAWLKTRSGTPRTTRRYVPAATTWMGRRPGYRRPSSTRGRSWKSSAKARRRLTVSSSTTSRSMDVLCIIGVVVYFSQGVSRPNYCYSHFVHLFLGYKNISKDQHEEKHQPHQLT